MATPETTQSDLAQALAADPDRHIRVETETGALGAAFHVTEIRFAKVSSLDCGHGTDEWSEFVVELLDSDTGKHMTAGTMSGIFGKSLDKLGRQDVPRLIFEASPGNSTLIRHKLDHISEDDSAVTLHLAAQRPVCKPAVRLSCC